MTMIRHYLVSALGRFRKAPVTTAANILTLALGLACFMAAYGVATYWSAGDTHHPGADRIYYIAQGAFGGEPGVNSSGVLPILLENEFPEVEAVTQFQGRPHSSMAEAAYSSEVGDAFLTAAVADAGLFDIFAVDFVEGGPATALRTPEDVVLTQDAARRLFGDASALGRSISFMGLTDFTVSGVIAPVRQPSFMGHTAQSPVAFDVLQNITSRRPEPPTTWNSVGGVTIVRLSPNAPVEAFQARLDALSDRATEQFGAELRLYARPISDLTTQLVNARILSQQQGVAGLSASAVLLALGALILAVACVNYANLSAAQAKARIKESGMRKVLGAGARAMLAQHMVEAVLLAVPALTLAVLMVALASPVLDRAIGVETTYFLSSDPGGILVLLAVALASAAAAALCPAFVTVRARASDAIGAGPARSGSGLLARVLVGIQFFSVSFLLIVVTVTQFQQAHLASRFNTVELDGDVALYLDWIPGVRDLSEIAGDGARASDFEVFRTQLLAAPQIRSVTAIDAVPLIDASGDFAPRMASPEAGATALTIGEKAVGDDYVETLGAILLAGRAFDPARDGAGGDVPPVVIDRRLAESLGYAEPEAAVGRMMYRPSDAADPDSGPRPPAAVIIGVVETDASRIVANMGPFGRLAGVSYLLDLDYRDARYPVLRVDGADVPGALAALDRVWDELQPDRPVRVRLAQDLIAEAYAPFQRIAAAFIALSLAALIISTTGILAIAVHVTARRRREIGVRKTLGASTARVLRMLILDFSQPVVGGGLIAWPFAWVAVQAYLQPFAERTPLTPVPFILSLAVTLVIAWLSVGGQAWRAARVSPASVLKYE